MSFPLKLSHVYCLLKSEMRNEAPEPSKIYADIDGGNIRICYSYMMMHCVYVCVFIGMLRANINNVRATERSEKQIREESH